MASHAEVLATRTARDVPGGTSWRTDFIRVPAGSARPMAFMSESTPGRVVRTHFHPTDQFQVFVRGGGMLGAHAIEPFTVHFTQAFTGYGPIVAGPQGVAWISMYLVGDGGAQYLPEQREALLAGRRGPPWQVSAAPCYPAGGKPGQRPLPGITNDRGLAAWSARLAPGAAWSAPSARGTGGQFLLLAGGAIARAGRDCHGLAVAHVAPEEPAFTCTAGPEGAQVLVLHFPRPDGH